MVVSCGGSPSRITVRRLSEAPRRVGDAPHGETEERRRRKSQPRAKYPRIAACVLAGVFLVPLCIAQEPAPQLQQAASLMQKGDLAGAEKILAAMLRSDSRNADATNMLGVLRGEQERYDESERLFQRALDLNPKLIGAAINLGYLYRRTGRPTEALAAFDRASKIQPADTEVQLNIASLKAEAGDFAAALPILDGVPKEKRTPNFPLLQARCYLALGRVEDLKASINDARRLMTPYPDLLAEYSQVLLNARMPDETINLLELVMGPSVGSYRVTFKLGEAYQMKGDLEKAARYYRMALAVEPTSVETLKRLAAIAQQREQWADMFNYMTDARQYAPNSTSVLYGFSLAALRTAHIADAQLAMYQAMSLEPDNPRLVYFYGVILMSMATDIPPAIETFKRYIKMKPDDPMGYLGLGFALYENGQMDAALEAVDNCLRLNPDLVEPRYYVGMIAYNAGDTAKALENLNYVISKEPGHAAAHAGIGAVYFRLKEYEKAKASLELAIKLNPDNATNHYQLSQVLMRMGNTEGAQAEHQLYTEVKARAQERRDAAGRLVGTMP